MKAVILLAGRKSRYCGRRHVSILQGDRGYGFPWTVALVLAWGHPPAAGRGRRGTRQWQLRRERAVIAVDRAAQQYQGCEPENRLVARELERRWEDSLKQQLDEEYERFVWGDPAELSDTALSSIRALPSDLPAMWLAAPRPRIVSASPGCCWNGWSSPWTRRVSGWTCNCTGSGAACDPIPPPGPWLAIVRSRTTRAWLARMRELCMGRDNSSAIAERLNSEGFRPPKRTKRFSAEILRRLTAHLGPTSRQRHESITGLEPDEYRPMGLGPAAGHQPGDGPPLLGYHRHYTDGGTGWDMTCGVAVAAALAWPNSPPRRQWKNCFPVAEAARYACGD